jgi:hypothetical protein
LRESKTRFVDRTHRCIDLALLSLNPLQQLTLRSGACFSSSSGSIRRHSMTSGHRLPKLAQRAVNGGGQLPFEAVSLRWSGSLRDCGATTVAGTMIQHSAGIYPGVPNPHNTVPVSRLGVPAPSEVQPRSESRPSRKEMRSVIWVTEREIIRLDAQWMRLFDFIYRTPVGAHFGHWEVPGYHAAISGAE